jgi:alpha-L-fucosidase
MQRARPPGLRETTSPSGAATMRGVLLLSTAATAASIASARQQVAPPQPPFNPFKFREAAAPGMDGWFKDAKLGMFMHWGPVSQWGTEISFPLLCSGLPCHPKGPNNTATTINTIAELSAHRQAYADLAKTFDPVDFDAANMAKLAKAAGFKYLVFTTVHCDGFINWPSNLTDYNIVNTPWGKKGRGTYAELVKAFRAGEQDI